MATYLISYRPEEFFSLNCFDSIYILTCKRVYFLGLFTRVFDARYTIPFPPQNVDAYHKKWDELIKTQKKLK